MTEKIIFAEADALTGEYTTRELQGAELTAYLKKRDELEKEAADKAKLKEEAKTALLTKLGITAEEAALLLSSGQSNATVIPVD
tara:strand:+ start:500 stop:751 length:252 start_codon:yes stop_codon:yes gene_type:complete